MKKLFALALVAVLVSMSGCSHGKRITELEDRVIALQDLANSHDLKLWLVHGELKEVDELLAKIAAALEKKAAKRKPVCCDYHETGYTKEDGQTGYYTRRSCHGNNEVDGSGCPGPWDTEAVFK
jgi:hypothetical protein